MKSTGSWFLLLFPEGTNFSPITIDKSNNYVDSNGMRRYERVLAPRVKGLDFILHQLEDEVQSIYDITIAFTGIKSDEIASDQFPIGKM